AADARLRRPPGQSRSLDRDAYAGKGEAAGSIANGPLSDWARQARHLPQPDRRTHFPYRRRAQRLKRADARLPGLIGLLPALRSRAASAAGAPDAPQPSKF